MSVTMQPTVGLRFVLRDGRYILQQSWLITEDDDDGHRTAHMEWRDVPVEQEN